MLEDRWAPAVQIFGGLEFMTTGSFNVSNNVVSSSSPVEVGVAPANGGSFTPLLLLQSGVEFNTTDPTGTFTTPYPGGASGGAVSAYAGGATVPLLDAHAHTFVATELLSSGYDVLSSGDTNNADLPVAGADLAVTGLHFAGSELDVQGNLSFADFPGLSLPVSGSNHVALTSSGVALTGLSVSLPASTSFSEAGLNFTTNDVTVQYTPSSNDFSLSGTASLVVAGNTLSITLGSDSAPGLVIADGALESFDASVTSNLQIGGLAFTTQNLTIQETADSDLTITGTASLALSIAGNAETLDVTMGDAVTGETAQPGIVIDQSTGELVSLDAVVTSDITIAGVDIKATDLGIVYSTGNNFAISGTASFSFDSNTVTITLGTAANPGLVIDNGALESLDASVTSNISLFGLTIMTNALTVDYMAAQANTPSELDVTGTASVAVAGNTLSITLGNDSTPGLVIVGGALQSFDASVTSNIKIGGLTFTTQNLTIQETADSDLTITGTASLALSIAGNAETLDVTLGDTVVGETAQPGIVIDQSSGDLVSLDAVVTSDITIAGVDIKATDLGIVYSTGNNFAISGTASFTFDSNTVAITLGTAANPGLVIDNGALESLDASVTSNISLFGLTIMTNALTVDYMAAQGNTPSELDVTGTASVAVAGNTLSITLGSDSTPGLVIVGGALQSFDASVTSNIKIGGLTFTTQNLTIQETADSDLTITGTASFSLNVGGGMDGVSVTLGGPVTGESSQPGIVINQSNGQLVSLDAAISGEIMVAGLDIQANSLGIVYQPQQQTYIISGGASFSFDGASVSIMLGGTYSQGIVISGGALQSLQASVTGKIDLLGLSIQANSLTVAYVAPNGNSPMELALYGGIGVSCSFVTFNTTLGTQEDPGLLLYNGQLQHLNITVDGSFSLFGISVSANGLSVQYDNSTQELELSGGIMVDFTSSFEVAASISSPNPNEPGGLFINTATGALSISSYGLTIMASATLGPFSIQNLMISFSNGSGGVNFSASGAVVLPGGIDVDLEELNIVNGQLADIGLSVSAPIPIGDTGFFLDSMSGSLQNLNNISQLVVMASATVSFGETVTLPDLSPIIAGGTYSLIQATGSITVSASELDLSGSVSLVGGLLGEGSASIDLNWTTGIYMVTGNFSMFDHVFNFGGSLTITNAGDITLLAYASVNVPPQIPFIGGDSLGEISFFLQYEPGQPLTQDIVAAWTSVNLFFTSFTIGFEVDFNGDFNIINGNDVAALQAAATSNPAPSQYVYQQNVTVPSQTVAGSNTVAAQVNVSTPVLDGPYALSVVGSDTESADYAGTSGHYYTAYYLSHPDVIMDTLTFTVTIEQDEVPGGIVAGTGSFDAQGNFHFVPSGKTGLIVPTGGMLRSDGEVTLEWTNIPYQSYVSSITATYDASNAYFELLQQAKTGVPIPLATYSIDPESDDPDDQVESSQPAELMATDNGVAGTVRDTDGSALQTVYTLSQGTPDEKTVSFKVSEGGTYLGSGYFDSSGAFHFTPNGNPPIAPTSGSVSTNANGNGLLILNWPKAPSQTTTVNVTYASISNRVIDFSPSTMSSPNGVAGQYIIELVSQTQLPSNEVPAFSETDLYQLPTVSFMSGSPSLGNNGTLSGTLLANAYTVAAQNAGDQTTTISLYYNTTDSVSYNPVENTTTGTLIGTYLYSSFANNGTGSSRSHQFSFPGFKNLPAGPYYIYAVIDDGQNEPQTSAIAGPFTEGNPTPVLTGPNYVALAADDNAEEATFSAADKTALGIATSFANPVTVNLSLTGGGSLIMSGGTPTTEFTATYCTAAQAVSALDGLQYISDDTFNGAATLAFTVSNTLNGTTYTASDIIPLLTSNTHLVVTQSVDGTIPADPSTHELVITVTNPGGPLDQNGTDVELDDYLSPGLTVVSSSASEGTFDATTGEWLIGNLPITGPNSATLTLMLQASPSTQGRSLTSTADASSSLFNYPKSDTQSATLIERPHPITISVTNLNDSGLGSLRNAIEYAENGDTIGFAPNLSGTITLSSGELLINEDLTIVGSTTSTGAPAIVISGNKASRVFDIEGGTQGIDVTLQNLAIENGLAGAQAANDASAGGGLLINDLGGTLTLSNLLVSGNVAQGAAGANAFGGGVAFLGGTATFADDTLANNRATGGSGGEGLAGAFFASAGYVTLYTDTIANNQAADGPGGGLDAVGGDITLSNDTFAGNTAAIGGDVSQAAPAFVEALNSVFANPGATFTAPDFGGIVGFSDHNLIDNAAGSTGFTTADGDLINIAADLAPLGNYGGPQPTMLPLAGSPLINAGDVGVLAQETIPGLVSFWQGNGNALDTANNNNSTLEGGVTFAPGASGNAFVLNGSSTYIQTSPNPANLSLNDMISVSALVDPTIYTSDSVIVDKTASGDAANYRFGIFGGGELFFWNGSQAVFSNAVIPLNTFTQVGFTLDAATDTLQFYVNGVLDSTRTVGFGALNTAPVFIGRALPGQFFEGMIEDVAIYHGVLTGAQMSLLAPPVVAAPTFPTYSGLVSQIVAQNGAVDTTGNTTPSVSGNVTYGTGVVGQEFELFGGNTQITVPNISALDSPEFTIGGWFDIAQAPSAGLEYYLASKYDGNYHGWILRLNSTLVPTLSLLSSPGGNVNATSSRALSLDTWYYISATFDGTTGTLYIDGSAVASTALPGGYAASATPLVIGAASWFNGGNLLGYVDDFSYYDGVLSAAQLQGVMGVGNIAMYSSQTVETGAATISGLVTEIAAQNAAAVDTTGNSTPTASPSVTYAAGIVGQAIQLNGTDGQLSVPDNATLDTPTFTIGGWFNVSQAPATGSEYYLASKYDGNYHGWILRLSSSLVPNLSLLSSPTGNVSAVSSQTLSLNTWYFISATFDGTTGTLYINGSAVASAKLPGGYTASTTPLVVGAASWTKGGYFAGAVDDFSYFNRVLGTAELRSLVVTGSVGTFQVTTADLADFYGGQGNALDSAGTSNGTIVGGVSYAPGIAGEAFNFSGEGSYLALGAGPDIVGTGAFALAAWVKTTSTGTQVIINQRDPSNFNGEYSLSINGGNVNFYTFGNNQFGFNITTTATVNDGQWHLIVAQRLANGTGEIYIDGTLAASQTAAAVPLSAGFQVYIGEDVRDAVDVGSGYSFNFVGDMEQVQIYKGSLSLAQIQTLGTNPGAKLVATTDQRGDSRMVNGGLDIGADELQYDLAITGGTPSVGVNKAINYTFTVTNYGPDADASAMFTDNLPQGVTYQSLSAPAGWTVSLLPSPTGGELTATDSASLATGASATFALVVTANTALGGIVYPDTASVGPTLSDKTLSNNSVTLSALIPLLPAVGVDIEGQPSNTVIGQPISPAITVNIVDGNANTIPTNSTQLVTLSIFSGPPGAKLGGETTVRAIDGVATFTGLTLNLAGTYVLKATGGSLTPDFSNPFTVAPIVVTNGLKIQRSPLRNMGRRGHSQVMKQTVKITNTTRSAQNGPLAILLEGVPAGVTLARESGTFDGSPYIEFEHGGKGLARRKTATVTLDFSVPKNTAVSRQTLYNDLEAVYGL